MTKIESKRNVSREVKASRVMSAFNFLSNPKLIKDVPQHFMKSGTNQTENPKRTSAMRAVVQ